MGTQNDPPVVPALWIRHDSDILQLWWDRLCTEMGPVPASRYAGGLFDQDRRRPIAQWYNPALNAALLVAIETGPEWPVQRFAVFYAPPGRGFTKVHMNNHEWFTRTPKKSPTEEEAFAAAVRSAEEFLQVEMDFI
ncbi:hypothetical protein QO003_002605 [Arthrobacter silviterrae]|uniref:Uncharacterized protein n=1 Tax=Arthrobacter silviterrae TaxID=2026658 RepID=A0ABX0DFR7_9MICC|nr:hypothetical protein [Arthrobacter silviterrae]MDQ0278302.1 hypothetical protein [Arthrobacter silviterrae]NGN85463.1 hypothetical protein [Arthrobacter silviterrae]